MLYTDGTYIPETYKPDPLPIDDLWEAIQSCSFLLQGSAGTGFSDETRDRERLDWLCEARDSVLAFLTAPFADPEHQPNPCPQHG